MEGLPGLEARAKPGMPAIVWGRFSSASITSSWANWIVRSQQNTVKVRAVEKKERKKYGARVGRGKSPGECYGL